MLAAMTTALLLIAHGTRNPLVTDEAAALCGLASERLDVPVGYSWIEHDLVDPSPQAAASELASQGAQELVTLPFLAFGAGHAKTDVPALISEVGEAHPHLTIRHGAVLGLHAQLFALARRRLAEAREAAGRPGDVPADEALLVTGPGTSDPDANGDLGKAARFLAETSGHRWCEIAFAGVTWPRVATALRVLHAGGFRHVTRFSWSLLPGRLEERVDDEVAAVAAETGVQVVDAGRFGPEPEIVDAIADRYRDALTGRAHANCDLCQFRFPLPGREKRAGLPSAGGTGERVAEEARAIQEARSGDPDRLEWKGA